MKRTAATLVTVLISSVVLSGQEWPDGSKIDRWFRNGPEKTSRNEARKYVVTEYGVKTDSTLLQTAAIQKVIDQAADNGGGTIVIPEGTFLSGSLFFKQGTHLHLDKGATLKGSDDLSDYSVVTVHIEGRQQPYLAALINVYNVNGFTLSGKGTVNGNGLRFWRDFWRRRSINPACTNLEALRPRLFYAASCSNVSIEGARLENPGFWTTHFYKCDHVLIKDISITAPMEPVPAPSSDAVDIDACSNVHITGCYMRNNDDLIAVKGGKGPWADKDPDNGTNSNILIENCTFGHGHSVLTFGSECIGGNNIIMRDCTVQEAHRVLQLKMRPDTPQKYENILVENVKGSTTFFFYVHPWTQFFDLQGREDIPMSYGRHITMRNCEMECAGNPIDVEECPDQYRLEDIKIENNNLKKK